jgi:modification target Cys-rich repeat protein
MDKNIRSSLRFTALPLVLAAVSAPIAWAGCDGEDSVLGDLAAQCGLTCPEQGIIEGNASISGIVSIDAFFGAVVDFTGAAKTVTASVRTQLDALALSVGLEAGASAADIRAAVAAKITANVEGGLVVKAQPPRCEANLDVTVDAAAACDVQADPGSIQVTCEGTCTIDASVQADCAAKGELKCKGQAPNLECSGTCTGDCSLEVAAACEGTCRGDCTGQCSVRDAAGNCKGKCEGTCQGTCELSAGGSCTGKCEGSCEYTPPMASCEANAEVRCTATADANIQCKGGCEGKVTPPSVSAECQATVEAKADASVECTPPSLDVTWAFKTGVDADAQADFKAWVGNFKGYFSGMLAGLAKAEILVESGQKLIVAADGAVTAAANAALEGDLKAKIGAGCALAAVPDVTTSLEGSAVGLNDSVNSVVEIQAAVGL